MPNTLAFDLEKFVPREEIEQVHTIVEALKANVSSPQPKSIAFQGEIGIGKSWLLQFLYQEFAKDEKLMVVYCDLKSYTGKDPSIAVLEIMSLFVNEEMKKNLGVSVGSASVVVMAEIQEVLKKKLLVTLIDHVYESDWKLLRMLEEYLLGPLAIESRTFFVLTGRGREYPWKTPELRLRSKFVSLKAFTLDQTKDQLKRMAVKTEQAPDEIYKNSNGNPLANSLLINETREQFDQAIERVLESIPIENRKQMRMYLEALCVLRYFDEERIPAMLKAYDPSIKLGEEHSQASKIRDELVRTAFARWDDEKGGFVMDTYWQRLLSKYLELYEHQKWLKLHRAAVNLYKSWVKEYKTASKFWEKEIMYHESVADKTLPQKGSRKK